MEVSFYGALAAAEDFSCFGGIQPFEKAQHHDITLAAGKCRERVAKIPECVEAAGVGGGVRARRKCLDGGLAAPEPAPAARLFARRVEGYLVEPCGEFGPWLGFQAARLQLQEDFLDHVVRCVVFIQETPSQPVDVVPMAVEQGSECLIVAWCASEQHPVVAFLHQA